MTKHEEEVRFLEAAAGLELSIMRLQGEIAQQQAQRFFHSIDYPLRPASRSIVARTSDDDLYVLLDSPKKPVAPTEKVPIRARDGSISTSGSGRSISAPPRLSKRDFSKEKGMFEGKTLTSPWEFIRAGGDMHGYDCIYGYNYEDCIIEYTPSGSLARMIRKHNETVKARYAKMNEETIQKYRQEMQAYEQQMKQYEQQRLELEKQLAEFQQKRVVFNQQVEQKRNAWLAVQNDNLQTLVTALEETQEQLAALYGGTRILPKPYQYPEAVLYLYEFLSSSSDDYDIKYALERVDANEMKRLMATLIQNQSRQAQLMASILSSVQTEIERLGSTTQRQLSEVQAEVGRISDRAQQQLSVAEQSLRDSQRQHSIAEKQLSVAEQSLRDSQRFLLKNTDMLGRLKPYNIA